MTRLTPTRTRPDIVIYTLNYTVVQSYCEGVTAMNLHPRKGGRNYFRVIPREEAEGTAYHSSQWETNRNTHSLHWLAETCWKGVVKFNKKKKGGRGFSEGMASWTCYRLFVKSVNYIVVPFLDCLSCLDCLRWSNYDNYEKITRD